ncbi:hypothetical protein [Paenibacillus sp. J23TS9]|uniref:hypothetical protein n=1 Tax=Paenibacillus sp. J23TS9 TaxID=2807193 RepID=UPI001BCB528E|nr:hypothetical protein [Paenibacillus sp. J23TS9]
MQLMIAELERKIENARHYLHPKELTHTWNASEEAEYGKPITRLHTMIEHVFKPAYFINPVEEKQHPKPWTDIRSVTGNKTLQQSRNESYEKERYDKKCPTSLCYQRSRTHIFHL